MKSVLLDPQSLSTPAQRLFAAGHQTRLERMSGPKPAPRPKLGKFAVPPMKDLWFSIVGDFDLKDPMANRPKIRDIQGAVADYFDMSRIDLLSKRRTRNIVIPRHIAVYLTKTLTLHSYPEIGRRFNYGDHTVALFAFNKIRDSILTDPGIAYDVAMLTDQISCGALR